LINNFIYSRKFRNNFFLIIVDISIFSVFFSAADTDNSINNNIDNNTNSNNTDNNNIVFFNNNITVSISGKSVIFDSDLDIDTKNIDFNCNSVFYKIFNIDTNQ